MEETIKIPVSKKKIILLLIASSVFIFIGVYMLLYTDTKLQDKVMATVGIVFFGLAFIVLPPKLFDRTPGLIIDRFGVTDNITKPRVGTIEWEDISHVEITKISSNKMLLIFVRDPEKYFDRVKGYNYSGLINNYALFGTPFIIPSSVLTTKLEDIKSLINSKIG